MYSDNNRCVYEIENAKKERKFKFTEFFSTILLMSTVILGIAYKSFWVALWVFILLTLFGIIMVVLDYKNNKIIYNNIKTAEQYNYDFGFSELFICLLMPIFIKFENNVLYKEVKPNRYRYQIICITKNNGETLYYAIVKKYITNIRSYIYKFSDCYLDRDSKFAYKTYAEAQKAVNTYKSAVLKKFREEVERKQKEANALKRLKDEEKKEQQEKRQIEKQQKFNQKIKVKRVINL